MNSGTKKLARKVPDVEKPFRDSSLAGDVVKSLIAPIIVGLAIATAKGESLKGLSSWMRLQSLLNIRIPLWGLLLLAFVVAALLFALRRAWKRNRELRTEQEQAVWQHTFEGFSYLPYMHSEELLVVLNDGKTWTHRFGDVLHQRVVHEGKPLKVLVIHPNAESLKVLLRKNGRELHVQLSHLRETFLAVEELRRLRPDMAEVRGHQLFNPYMLHLTEQVAIMHPYLYKERKELPVFTFSKDEHSELYSRIRRDALELWQVAVPLKASDFSLLDEISAHFQGKSGEE